MARLSNKKRKKTDALKIASGKSFDLKQPYIPGGQDYEGIPNATPEMLRKLQQRKLKNPGGQSLPGFVREA
jgi:hypothetical protein